MSELIELDLYLRRKQQYIDQFRRLTLDPSTRLRLKEDIGKLIEKGINKEVNPLIVIHYC